MTIKFQFIYKWKPIKLGCHVFSTVSSDTVGAGTLELTEEL